MKNLERVVRVQLTATKVDYGVAVHGYFASTAFLDGNTTFEGISGRKFGWVDLDGRKWCDERSKFSPMTLEEFEQLDPEIRTSLEMLANPPVILFQVNKDARGWKDTRVKIELIPGIEGIANQLSIRLHCRVIRDTHNITNEQIRAVHLADKNTEYPISHMLG